MEIDKRFELARGEVLTRAKSGQFRPRKNF